MAINYPDDKKNKLGGTFPEHAVGAAQVTRCEPLLTPAKLRTRFLKGLPLVSPLNGDKITDTDLKDFINRAIGRAELDGRIDITPVQRRYKLPFDRNLYQHWVHLRLPNTPILSIESMTITTADDTEVFKMPQQWIEGANFQRGIVNVIPISPAFAAVGAATSAAQGGAAFLTFIGQLGWVPAYWQIEWTSGWPEKKIPVVVNELIGCVAAIMVLSMLASLHKTTGHALSTDGLSQSVSTPGPQVFVQRISDLEDEKAQILKRLKTITGNAITMSNV